MRRVGLGLRWVLALWLSGLPLVSAMAVSADSPAPPAPPAAAVEIVDGPPASLPNDFPGRAWRVFSVNDTLPDNLVYAIAQDRRGLIYAGLGNGLARYNGAVWKRLPLPGVHGVHAVGAVIATGDGSLWVGDDGDGVFHLSGDHIEALPGLAGQAKVVYRLAADGHAGVWAATGGGLARCTSRGCQLHPLLRGKDVLSVTHGVGPKGPCLWVGISGEGLRRYDLGVDGELRASDFLLSRKDGLPNGFVVDVVQWGGHDGRDLWIATGRGLVRYDGHRVVRYTTANGFTGSTIALLLGQGRDRGLLFAALRPGGLAMIREDGQWRLIGPAQGLPDSAAQALAYTRMGSGEPLLWVGTVDGGLARADPERWQVLDERRDVPSRGLGGLGRVRFPDGIDTVWMGATQGPRRLTDSGWQAIPGLPGSVVADMASTADGSFWMATRDGLWRLQGDQRELITTDNSRLPAVYARQLTVEHTVAGDVLWIATNHGLARWSQADGLQREAEPPLLAEGQGIIAATVAALGKDAPSVWIATNSGLLRRLNGHWQAMAETCLHDATVTTLVAHQGTQGGELWIGTDGPLVRLHLHGCERRDGLFPGSGITQMVFDRNGSAWLFGGGGALRIDATRTARLSTMPMQRFGREDGLLASDFLHDRGVAIDAAGHIWVASTTALQVFDPNTTVAATRDARLIWETASAGTAKQPVTAGVELTAGTTPLVFSARLLAFGREGSNAYRVQLRGLHREPQAWTGENRFDFNRLAAGQYEVLLWGRDGNGMVFGPLRLPFSILAPWWQRPWAIALWAGLLIACGLVLGWWRSRALRLRARQLAEEVATRTSELAAANHQLEAMARTDALTGLHNRRHAIDTLPELVRRDARRRHDGEPQQLLLVLLDVDHFKRVNDTHGHAVGDCVLLAVATRLRVGIREGDMLVRWGGEEFLVAFDDCDPDHANTRLLTLLEAVATTPVATDSEPLAISVSAGAAVYAHPAAMDEGAVAQAIEHAIARADAALYEAKRNGRDRVVIATAGIEEPARWPQYPRMPAAAT